MRVSVHYYKRNIGDYAAKAGHLSPLEHGVYTLLLDAYYNREEAPTRADAIRWARARTQDEVAAVDAVLSEFFTESEGRYRQQRVEDELRAYHGKAQVNRETAIKREQAKRERTDRERSTKRAQGVHESCSKREPNHKPLTINQEEELKSTVQPAAARSRFDAFWAAYPVKKGKQQARKAWNRIKLDARCDELIAHVRTMQAHDDGWRRGFIPMGSTYLNQARWEDVPTHPPRAGPEQLPGKQMQGIMALEEMKNAIRNRMAGAGNPDGTAKAVMPVVGSDARR